ncbi:MAG: UbiH/UbiF/VisC/COQ6 family ubiquinone biosynthesis hydroxylase [Blastomonas sp.]
MQARKDAAILGGGLVGLIQALALARHGLSCTVIERSDMQAMRNPAGDGRASALASTSWQLLANLGLADALAPSICPIERISVCEALKPGALDFAAEGGSIDTEPHAGGYMGVMIANDALRAALFEAVCAQPLIEVLAGASAEDWNIDDHGVTIGLGDGRKVTASLLISAEGRNSRVRERAGIAMTHWRYDQGAMTGTIDLEQPHDFAAFEIFYCDGPLAILPLLDDQGQPKRASFVWTVPQDRLEAMLALSDRAFAAHIEKAMGGFLGKIAPVSPRSGFPLGLHQAASLTAQRVALVGDAGHGIHPIAGQGLNLGLRDAAALAEVLGDGVLLGLDAGDAQLLARYERWRAMDIGMMTMATDGLVRLFGVPGKTASAVRRFGMSLVEKSPAAKRFFIAEARGESGELPRLLQPAL